MTNKLRIALAQLNPTVGALSGNFDKAKTALADAIAASADILMFPELYVTGYFPEDLLFNGKFVAEAMGTVDALAEMTRDEHIAVLVPCVWQVGSNLFNAVMLLQNGEVVDWRAKHDLPGDDVFYEQRYFTPGVLPEPMTIHGVRVGVPVCEDIWQSDVCACLARSGAEMLLCPNGSPYRNNVDGLRKSTAMQRVGETGLPLLYLNQVGGQDELVFDGASFGVNSDRSLAFQAGCFGEELIVSDWIRNDCGWVSVDQYTGSPVAEDEALWRACVLGLRDYIHKNGFRTAVLGLSGGIDSAVAAAMATDALGPTRVHCVMLPYRFTSEASLDDARNCAERLNVRYDVVPIYDLVRAADKALAPLFEGLEPGLAEENLQSRLRGSCLMGISNKLGSMLVTTGNKSEMAVGYATIYGDMNGGYNPLKDLYKTRLYQLAEWRNRNRPTGCLGPVGEVIPPSIIARAPSAELREGQTDQDSLPPYPVLDAILEQFFERNRSVTEILAAGFNRETVARVQELILTSEYKRSQSAPGPKLTAKAFGRGRKYPLTNGYSDKGH